MTETTIMSQLRAEWPPAMARRTTRGRREAKVAYRNAPAHTVRNSVAGPSNYASSPEEPFSRKNNLFQVQATPPQPLSMDLSDYFNVQQAPAGNAGFPPIVHQNFQDDSSWYSSFSSNTYTLASNPPSSPQYQAGNNAQSPRNAISRISTDALDVTWTNITPVSPMAGSDTFDMTMSEMDFGSYDSFGSMQLLPTPSTAASDFSEEFAFPPIAGTGSPQVQKEMPDLTLTNAFYRTGIRMSTSSPDDFLFENDFIQIPQNFTYGNVYSTDTPQWSSSTIMSQQPQMNSNAPVFTPASWDSQNAQISGFQVNADPGIVAFEPRRGNVCEAYVARQQYLDTAQTNTKYFGPEPISPSGHSDCEGWVVASYAPSSYAASHGSPHSHASPASHPPSPVQHETKRHSHIFDSLPGVQKTTKVTRGRQRGLTALEKKQARDVRDAKACWACHISKTKCSPCSPGKPCEQCARLAGKRRFCLFSCFNEPLETLSTFMVPDYLMGHFTRANVEKFVAQNATTWGTECLVVRMTWGYRKLLKAEVVALALRSNASEMAFQDQAITHGDERPRLVRKQSPPIGIPLAAMDEMQDIYSSYIQDIIRSDLGEYVPVAYTDQESEFAEELLGAVCNYYSAGLAVDNESEILRRAIEMHITATILERSLVLDAPSLHTVQSHLHQFYPSESAPRCAQRQIKLAFFLLQQRRIHHVLKEWGSMMWATNTSSVPRDKEWATAFCVFIILILVMDKTLGAAYYFCEGRIKHDGYEAEKERREFLNLVRLTQKELFERCKEIFHWKFKTRKGGKEACNPIRDGCDSFVGKVREGEGDGDVARLVGDLQSLVGGFGEEIHDHKTFRTDVDSEYTDAGRLACIFLDDF